MHAISYAADSDKTALHSTGAAILHDLTDLPDKLAI